MDLMRMCMVSARARIWDVSSALIKACRSMIVVCIPLLLRVMTLISGCV